MSYPNDSTIIKQPDKVKKPKNPKRVAQGNVLAQWNKEDKENKAKTVERVEERESEERESEERKVEHATGEITSSNIFLMGAIAVGVIYFLKKQDSPPQQPQPPQQTPPPPEHDPFIMY